MKQYLLITENGYFGNYPFYAGELLTHKEIKKLSSLDLNFVVTHSEKIFLDDEEIYFYFDKKFIKF